MTVNNACFRQVKDAALAAAADSNRRCDVAKKKLCDERGRADAAVARTAAVEKEMTQLQNELVRSSCSDLKFS